LLIPISRLAHFRYCIVIKPPSHCRPFELETL
jgi:hypothetical protein